MPMPTVKVTQDHIEIAKPRDSGHCMIADAVKDSVPGALRVSVDLATIRYTRNGKRYTFLTPRPVQVALVRFDQGDEKALAPFSFRLPKAAQITESTRPTRKRKLQVKSEHAPVVKGGRTPPRGALSDTNVRGRIRRFGLRSLGE